MNPILCVRWFVVGFGCGAVCMMVLVGVEAFAEIRRLEMIAFQKNVQLEYAQREVARLRSDNSFGEDK